jgi:hypothetical protein
MGFPYDAPEHSFQTRAEGGLLRVVSCILRGLRMMLMRRHRTWEGALPRGEEVPLQPSTNLSDAYQPGVCTSRLLVAMAAAGTGKNR